MRNIDLDSLEIFQAVVTEGGISRAAQKLHRVQSNISTRIKQLEQRLDTRLFLRQGRSLRLSPEGEVLLGYADKLLRLAAEAEASLSGGPPSGTLRIGSMESTAAARLPPLLSRYHQLYPQVDIVIATDTADGLLQRLLQYDIDVAFVAEPVLHNALDTRRVFLEELVLLSPPSRAEAPTAANASGATLIAFRSGCAYRRYLEEWLRQSGVVPGAVIEVSSYHAIIACVAAGTGIAVVPRSVLEVVPEYANLQLYPLPGRIAKIHTLLAWRQDYGGAKLDALKQILAA